MRFIDPDGKGVFDWVGNIWDQTISSVGNYFSHSSTKSIVKETASMAAKDIESSSGGKLALDVTDKTLDNPVTTPTLTSIGLVFNAPMVLSISTSTSIYQSIKRYLEYANTGDNMESFIIQGVGTFVGRFYPALGEIISLTQYMLPKKNAKKSKFEFEYKQASETCEKRSRDQFSNENDD
jgi:hypothetical protein